jgi:hypothetical protein
MDISVNEQTLTVFIRNNKFHKCKKKKHFMPEIMTDVHASLDVEYEYDDDDDDDDDDDNDMKYLHMKVQL